MGEVPRGRASHWVPWMLVPTAGSHKVAEYCSTRMRYPNPEHYGCGCGCCCQLQLGNKTKAPEKVQRMAASSSRLSPTLTPLATWNCGNTTFLGVQRVVGNRPPDRGLDDENGAPGPGRHKGSDPQNCDHHKPEHEQPGRCVNDPRPVGLDL